MTIRKGILNIVSVLWFVVPISAQVIRVGGGRSTETQPQKTMRYINPLVIEEAGRLANPNVITFRGKYYLYLTGGLWSGGHSGPAVWSSDDLVNWEHHRVSIFQFESSHIWERYGNRNEYSTQSWIEGPWMTKWNDTYYLQYAAPGTDWITYGVGVYTSESPLGPFTYYEGSPILLHRHGMLNGCAHHSVVEGPDGTVWAIYTLLYRNWNRMFERRIGMDPGGFDEEGNMVINGPTETPQWAPAEDDEEPTLSLDLGAESRQEYIVDSARLIFLLPAGLKREGAEPRIRQYKIEVSSDGKTFTTVVDKTKSDRDNAVEFNEITPVKCRHVRLTITGWPKDLPCGVIEFTVFGRPTPT